MFDMYKDADTRLIAVAGFCVLVAVVSLTSFLVLLLRRRTTMEALDRISSQITVGAVHSDDETKSIIKAVEGVANRVSQHAVSTEAEHKSLAASLKVISGRAQFLVAKEIAEEEAYQKVLAQRFMDAHAKAEAEKKEAQNAVDPNS